MRILVLLFLLRDSSGSYQLDVLHLFLPLEDFLLEGIQHNSVLNHFPASLFCWVSGDEFLDWCYADYQETQNESRYKSYEDVQQFPKIQMIFLGECF